MGPIAHLLFLTGLLGVVEVKMIWTRVFFVEKLTVKIGVGLVLVNCTLQTAQKSRGSYARSNVNKKIRQFFFSRLLDQILTVLSTVLKELASMVQVAARGQHQGGMYSMEPIVPFVLVESFPIQAIQVFAKTVNQDSLPLKALQCVQVALLGTSVCNHSPFVIPVLPEHTWNQTLARIAPRENGTLKILQSQIHLVACVQKFQELFV
jgi:hypothetical protein